MTSDQDKDNAATAHARATFYSAVKSEASDDSRPDAASASASLIRPHFQAGIGGGFLITQSEWLVLQVCFCYVAVGGDGLLIGLSVALLQVRLHVQFALELERT